MIDATDPSAAPPLPDGAGWLGYRSPAGSHDEAFTADGEVRSHWHAFLGSLRELGPGQLHRRWTEARRLIRQNGVTYNVYGDPRGMERPWQLDPIPLLLPPVDAEHLEAGLIQRARLLEALLRDLYGAQQTLAEGLLPAELVFGNPAFLRPCHGITVPLGHYLHLYAVNVCRDAGGYFWVLGDRAQCPSGAGYALENRIVVSRMLPEIYRDCRVQRLALFFNTLRDTLRAIAPRRTEQPHIVLLTPGPYNETYFEHAYLARYLGYPLVEGGDLTVRDNRVFLKVLDGLRPVDVLFRRLDDDFCDPLELRHDSFLGVPGLVQAVRAGTVAVANALGSGLLETPALLAFLPALCRRLLGEEMRLPSVPTWWCGQPRECEYVLTHLDELVVKPALPGVRLEPIFGHLLTAAQRDELAERIRARPRAYIGQQRIDLATAPVLVGERVEPRAVVMRAYLGARGDSFSVMPGGLARVSAAADSMVVSMQRGGGSKDTWVLSAGPVSPFSLLRPDSLPVELNRGGNDLPSRVADNLYWLGRYAERAEGLTRLLRGVLVRLTETSGLAEVPELPTLLRSVTWCTESYPGFVAEGAEARIAAPEAELLAVLHDTRRSGSLASILQALSRVLGSVRDRISTDMWRVLRDLGKPRRAHALFAHGEADHHRHGAPPGHGDGQHTLSEERDALDRTVLTLAAFGGLAMESVTRGDGWRFLDMGRKLERCMHILRLLRCTVLWTSPHEGPLLEALLEITDSSMTYRRRYQGNLQVAAVLDLLLADESNPRALAFQLAALADDVEHLPRDQRRPTRSAEQRLILATLTALRLVDVTELAQADGSGRRRELTELLSRLATDLPALSEAVTLTYLSHLQVSRHLGVFAGPAEAVPPARLSDI